MRIRSFTLAPAATGLLLVAVLGRGVRAEEPDVRDWPGLLPTPLQQGFPGDEPELEWFAVRVRDARTGRPVVGARWSRTPEWIAPGRLRHDAVMEVAHTDAEGIARIRTLRYAWKDDCHWIVQAEGYAPYYDYSAGPRETEVFLEQGVRFHGRVLDGLGAPVVGARVDVLGGCSHGTPLLTAHTDGQGAFDFASVPPGLGGQLWVEGRGIEADLIALDDPPSLGAAGVVLAMDSGQRHEGLVTDLVGEPLAGVVVRAWNEQRGPTAITDTAGRFVIDGVAPGNDLRFYPPADLLEDEACRMVEDHAPGVPFRVALGVMGIPEVDDGVAVLVRVRDPAGAPVESLRFQLLDARTGRGPAGGTADEDPGDSTEPERGSAVVRTRPGPHRLVPTDPFGAHTFAPVAVEVLPDGSTVADVVAIERPRLRIQGEVPKDAFLTLSVPGDATSETTDASWEPHLPAEGPAALRVRVDDRPPFFFPVGPAVDGRRSVEVRLPAPRRIGLPAGARDARLRDGRREAYARREKDCLLTDASGSLTVEWKDAEGTRWRAAVLVPATESARIEVDASEGAPVIEEVVVRALEDGDDAVVESVEASPGEWVRITRAGWRTLETRAPDEGEATLRWGTATLRLRVPALEEAEADGLLLLPEAIYVVPGGRLELRGLHPGPLRLVVARQDEVGRARESSILLAPGEVRELTVELTP
jgi:hypothetical protein